MYTFANGCQLAAKFGDVRVGWGACTHLGPEHDVPVQVVFVRVGDDVAQQRAARGILLQVQLGRRGEVGQGEEVPRD